MDAKKAIQSVVANLRLVANHIRSDQRADHKLADRLETIASRIETLEVGDADEGNEDPELLADTLSLLESFRDIKSPEARKAVVAMIRALRPERNGR